MVNFGPASAFKDNFRPRLNMNQLHHGRVANTLSLSYPSIQIIHYLWAYKSTKIGQPTSTFKTVCYLALH